MEEKRPKAVVIMTAPTEANCIITELTTTLRIKNLNLLGYGGCGLVNLDRKLNFNKLIGDKTKEDYNKQNRETILKCLSDANNEKAILARGSCEEDNKSIQGYRNILLDMLSGYKEKLYIFRMNDGKRDVHPLTPSV